MARITFKQLEKEAIAKGLTLMRYPDGGYSLDKGEVVLYGSGYGSKLTIVKGKLDRLVATTEGEIFPNGNGVYKKGWQVTYPD